MSALRPMAPRTLPFQLPMDEARLSGPDGFFIARFRALIR